MIKLWDCLSKVSFIWIWLSCLKVFPLKQERDTRSTWLKVEHRHIKLWWSYRQETTCTAFNKINSSSKAFLLFTSQHLLNSHVGQKQKPNSKTNYKLNSPFPHQTQTQTDFQLSLWWNQQTAIEKRLGHLLHSHLPMTKISYSSWANSSIVVPFSASKTI